MLAELIMVIFSQYKHTSNHYAVHLTKCDVNNMSYMTYINYTSIKLGVGNTPPEFI